ncbi:DUF4031 domain-containing protein [Chitinivorax sp. B]|uniref:DUF4031 domain-containing protein n=1 Tax=Chitinivorax sp. B TaxID=2502235 RepID=UPI0010F63568|nr:DUF4031 domain-containing protein [Chitinivorax sp. B]
MAVYIDNVKIEWRGRRWCHMVADSIDELHEFAKRLGLQRAWFQHEASYPHYDVTVETRARALRMGASPGDRSQIMTCAYKLKAELAQPKAPQFEQLALFR